MAGWGQLEAGVVGVGVGEAAGIAIGPVLEPERQHAWLESQARLLDLGTLARLVAQGLTPVDKAVLDAKRLGFTEERFRAAVQTALQAPPVAETLQLWRRGLFGPPTSVGAIAKVDHALAKAQVEPQFWGPIKELFGSRLDAPVIALAIVRGIMADPGFLPVGPPTTEGRVAAFPVSPLDPIDEARATGIDKERLFIETAIAGRPMGPEAAASAVFRQILERVDYDRAIAEGDVRNEWADAIFETARQIPSVADYVALHLRGHTDAAGMHAGAARHGMSADDADRIYLARGRPAAPGQMATAAARGIDGPLGRPMDREQFLLGIAESDIRPEWGPMLWEARYLYPPLFQLTRLVQAGAIDADTAREWARKDRYPPEVVAALHAYWLTLGGSTADPHVAKAENQLWTALHKSYVNGEADTATARSVLAQLGVTATAQTDVLGLWDAERALIRKQLTPAQIKRAYTHAAVNEATGAPWTRDEALAALIGLGYAPDTAGDFLNL